MSECSKARVYDCAEFGGVATPIPGVVQPRVIEPLNLPMLPDFMTTPSTDTMARRTHLAPRPLKEHELRETAPPEPVLYFLDPVSEADKELTSSKDKMFIKEGMVPGPQIPEDFDDEEETMPFVSPCFTLRMKPSMNFRVPNW